MAKRDPKMAYLVMGDMLDKLEAGADIQGVANQIDITHDADGKPHAGFSNIELFYVINNGVLAAYWFPCEQDFTVPGL